MKLSALQQSYVARRANSFRGSALDSSADSPIKSPAGIFWLILHGLCCLISLVLGFRFSRLVFFLFFSSPSTTTNFYLTPFHSSSLSNPTLNLEIPVNKTLSTTTISSRVVVGRHGIRIRPWPHPNPTEVMKAHQIIETVQMEQKRQYGVKNPRKIIAVTPTYVRTFQALHMTGVMHSLMLVPYEVVWIVVEAGGVTNETASIVAKSGLEIIHVGFDQRMPNSWDGRHRVEAQMRLQALRIVSQKMLDGIVIFMDDSNMHSMELFDEIQNVKLFGALSVGILIQSDKQDESSEAVTRKEEEVENENPSMPAQGPACNSSDKLVGWHTFNALPYAGKSAKFIGDKTSVLPRKLEWSGFVLNSRLIWKDAEDKPEWVKDFDTLAVGDDDLESPLFLLKDASMVEPLGSCGRQVLLWWLRVEARFDSKFPHGWLIDPPLEITVPAKRTPWPDAPPELPTDEKARIGIHEETVKLPSTKTHSSRSRRSSRSKRKRHETKAVDTQNSEKN